MNQLTGAALASSLTSPPIEEDLNPEVFTGSRDSEPGTLPPARGGVQVAVKCHKAVPYSKTHVKQHDRQRVSCESLNDIPDLALETEVPVRCTSPLLAWIEPPESVTLLDQDLLNIHEGKSDSLDDFAGYCQDEHGYDEYPSDLEMISSDASFLHCQGIIGGEPPQKKSSAPPPIVVAVMQGEHDLESQLNEPLERPILLAGKPPKKKSRLTTELDYSHEIEPTEHDVLHGRGRFNLAQLQCERDRNERNNQWERRLHERMSKLTHMKDECANANGNIDASDEDLVEVNAGGKIVVAKRSTLTQIQGTMFEAIFSGRWDKKLTRDNHGHIFLDVNPTCFRAIVDYLNEMMISSDDSPPSPPIVDDEFKHLLRHQLKVFGIVPKVGMPDSTIIKDEGHCIMLHDWLNEDGSDGEFMLLYRGSRDGQSNKVFRSKCANMGPTITIIETTCGTVVGGYSNTSWSWDVQWSTANKAFLFAFSGSGILAPCKMKLWNEHDDAAICSNPSYGPIFGRGHDMYVDCYDSTTLHLLKYPGPSYNPGPLTKGSYTIKEMEVFKVSGLPPIVSRIAASTGMHTRNDTARHIEPDTGFSSAVEAITARQAYLQHMEAEMLQLEESFIEEQAFIEKFASGDVKDTISLNVSGTTMITTRATLCSINDSVLARQFDDSKWTEQGCKGPPVNEWTPDQVSTWAKHVHGLPEEVGIMLYENEITGPELLALSRDDLRMMGLKRIGTVALLINEIAKLEYTSRNIVTLIEHSPYCFGKILDYLRLKRLHLLGLIINEPALPEVCDSQKIRFEKVVRYYFPGDIAKSILGFANLNLEAE